MNKQKDDLQTFFEPIKQIWRRRELSFDLMGKKIDKIQIPPIKLGGKSYRPGPFYLDNSVPGSVLETIDALGMENKNGLKPVICHKHQEPYGWHVVLQLPPGISSRDIESKLSYFAEQAGGTITLQTKGSKVHMDISTKPLPEKVKYSWNPDLFKDMSMPVPIGETANGLLVIDLSSLPHMLVAGVPGGGKSNFLHVLTNSLIMLPNVWVVIIDLKRLEFSYLKERALVAYDRGMAWEVLTALNKELDRRLERLESASCVKIQEYKGDDMPYIACVIDELTELQNGDCQDKLNRIARLSRAVGISIVCATQRPSATTYNKFTDTRGLFDGTLCFRVRDAVNSRIVLDNDKAAHIPANIRGRAIWQWDRECEVQVMHLPINKAKKLLKNVPASETKGVKLVELSPERLLPR